MDIKEYKKKAEEPLKSEDELEMIEIIILKYKNKIIEKECLNRIIEYTEHPYKLTFYDNRWNPPNMSKIWNKLIKQSTCPYVLIMDTDAFVNTEDWTSKLLLVLKQLGVIAVGGVSPVFMCKEQSQEPCDGEPKEVQTISGYCFLINKKYFEKVGGFDEDFYIFGQDSEWFHRARKSGYKLMVVPSVEVRHGGNMETKAAADRQEYDWDNELKYAGILYQQKR